MYEWRTGRSCFYKNNVHLVFVTKYRQNALTLEMLDKLSIIFEDGHVHLMVSAHPKIAISNLIGKLKGKSSYMLRKSFWAQIKSKLWGNHFWSPSYCVVSVGGASLDVVKNYIENQRKPPSEKQINQSKKISAKGRGLA
jgi:putative transposase